MAKYEIFQEIQTESNKFHAFYSASPKRFNLLKEHLDLLGEPYFTPMQIYKVRWIASHDLAMQIMIKNMKSIISHLIAISSYKYDRKTEPVELYTQATIAKAIQMRLFFTEKNVMMAMNFNRDIQTLFKDQSLEFQTRYSTLIGQSRREEKLQYLLNLIDNEKGENLKAFLAKTICYQDNPANGRPCENIQEYDASHVLYEGYSLHEVIVKDKNDQDVNKYQKLSTWKSTYIQEIRNQLDAFFPVNGDKTKGRVAMKIFDVLDQTTWPVSPAKKLAYVPGSIEPIKALFGVANDDLQQEFERVVAAILADRKLYCRNKRSPPVLFWAKVLRQIEMRIELKSLLLKVLCIPFSSSDAERTFSLMNIIKSKERTRLSTFMLDHYLR